MGIDSRALAAVPSSAFDAADDMDFTGSFAYLVIKGRDMLQNQNGRQYSFA
jgi:hypothetical protein